MNKVHGFEGKVAWHFHKSTSHDGVTYVSGFC
jgi:hypothetical protein